MSDYSRVPRTSTEEEKMQAVRLLQSLDLASQITVLQTGQPLNTHVVMGAVSMYIFGSLVALFGNDPETVLLNFDLFSSNCRNHIVENMNHKETAQ